MKVEIKLFFNLVKYLPSEQSKNSACISLSEGATIQTLVDILGIPSEIQKTILVNGINAKIETEIKENDSVAIFPPMAGG